MQLSVKNIPLNCSLEELKGMFSQYGRVHRAVLMVGKTNIMHVVRFLRIILGTAEHVQCA